MAKQKKTTGSGREEMLSKLVKNQVLRTRKDIADWISARQAAENVMFPNRTRLVELYDNILEDDVFGSQIETRNETIIGSKFHLVGKDGKPNEEATSVVMNAAFYEDIQKAILMSRWYGHSLIQLMQDSTGEWYAELIPRRHVIPEKGVVKIMVSDADGIRYRETTEYRITILEFGKPEDMGMANMAVPNVLMKRFSTSAWSEFNEVFGQPTKVLKTNTQDATSMNRAESMLKEMGAAPYLIIDESEAFEFVAAITSDGDTYDNAITRLNSGLSMIVNGAVIGMDTKNGNYSKEESSKEHLAMRIRADKRMVVNYWNRLVLPALARLGLIPDGLKFQFVEEEDIDGLWKKVVDAAPYFKIDAEWITDKFGIPVMLEEIPF